MKLTPGTCQFCGCTETTPCPGGCAWTDETQTTCSLCAQAIQLSQLFLGMIGQLRPAGPGWSWDMSSPFWTWKQRRVFIMGARSILAGIPPPIDLQVLRNELAGLIEALKERYPDKIAEAARLRQPLTDLVLELLGEKRIVLTDARAMPTRVTPWP